MANLYNKTMIKAHKSTKTKAQSGHAAWALMGL